MSADISDEQIVAVWDAWPRQGITSRARAVEFARAVLALAAQPEAPAGWKLVPVEPTPEMLDAAARASMQHLLDCIADPAKAKDLGGEENIRKTHASRYRSMLAAVPPVGTEAPAVAEPIADIEVLGPGAITFCLTDEAKMLPVGKHKLYAAPSSPRAASLTGWQPIETAPKDGTLIVLGAKNGVWLGKYLPVYESGFRPQNPWSSMLLNHDHMAERYTRPTRWMPLPAAPGSSPEPARVALTASQVDAVARDAQIAFCLDKFSSFELAFAHGIQAAHGIGIAAEKESDRG